MSQPAGSPSQPGQQQQYWYRVLRPEIDSVAFDPLDPEKRYHEGVFVEVDTEDGKGTLFHVTGDVISANGMRYEEKADFAPGESARLHKSTRLGWVLKDDYHSGRIGAILQALPRPTKQQGINFWEPNPITGEHDIIWTKQNGERYGPGEQRRPTFKCNEWTHQHAIPALLNAGILRTSI